MSYFGRAAKLDLYHFRQQTQYFSLKTQETELQTCGSYVSKKSFLPIIHLSNKQQSISYNCINDSVTIN